MNAGKNGGDNYTQINVVEGFFSFLTQTCDLYVPLSLDKLSGERVKQVMEHIWKFQEFCNSMTRLEMDSYEYAYLKAIVLFSPGELTTISSLLSPPSSLQSDGLIWTSV